MRRVGSDPDDYIPPKIIVAQSNKSNGTATLGFTPERPGEYQLTIMVRNRPIPYHNRITANHPRHYKDFKNMPITYRKVGGTCYGVAVDDNGTVYATDYDNNTIKVFRPDGTEGQIGSRDEAGGNLCGPWGITLLDNTLYVTGTLNSMVSSSMVKVYSTDGGFISGFGGPGEGNSKFLFPQGICTDGKERVLVAENGNKQIHIFSLKGSFIKSFPCSSKPQDIAVDPIGNIHVALNGNNCIVVYSQDGTQIETYSYDDKFNPSGIYIDGEGNRFICDNVCVYITDPSGTLVSTRQISCAWGITVDNNGTIYVAESSKNQVSVY